MTTEPSDDLAIDLATDSLAAAWGEIEALRTQVDAMAEALDQALDDMGEDAHCVCPATKREMVQALSTYRKTQGTE